MNSSRRTDSRLQDKVCIVTGAASGIGRASAQRFAVEGAIVIAADINALGLERTVTDITAAGGRAYARVVDVTQADQVRSLVVGTATEYGRLDVLYNNAGGALPQATHLMSPEEYRRIIALNQDSVFYGIHAALPVMMRQRHGVLLATASGAGLNAVEELSAYGAAKAAVVLLMKAVAVEYGAWGIRANAIAPGPMATPTFREWVATLPGGAEGFACQVPLGRLGESEDIAAAAAFLASDDAAYITGAVLPVDGAVQAKLASPRVGR